MKKHEEIEAFRDWFRDKLGVNPDVVKVEDCLSKIYARMEVCKKKDLHAYYHYLLSSPEEQQLLIESVIVPETWFFREKGSLDYLVAYGKEKKFSRSDSEALKIISVACASGEEPYTIAMMLFDAGLAPAQFSVDAVDISRVSLLKAAEATYGKNSFRSKELEFRDTYFDELGNGNYHLKSTVRKQVTFYNANIVDQQFLLWPHFYDVIVCRNVLIYLNRDAQMRLFAAFDRILCEGGIVLLGHAEAELIRAAGYEAVKFPKACAFRKKDSSAALEEALQAKKLEKKQKALALEKGKEKRGWEVVTTTAKEKTASKEEHKTPAEKAKNDAPIWEDLLKEAFELADQGLLEEAKLKSLQLLKQKATNISANFLVATLYHALGEEGNAEEYFHKVVYLDPYHDEALVYLALLAEKRGDMEKADLLKKRVLKALARKNVS